MFQRLICQLLERSSIHGVFGNNGLESRFASTNPCSIEQYHSCQSCCNPYSPRLGTRCYWCSNKETFSCKYHHHIPPPPHCIARSHNRNRTTDKYGIRTWKNYSYKELINLKMETKISWIYAHMEHSQCQHSNSLSQRYNRSRYSPVDFQCKRNTCGSGRNRTRNLEGHMPRRGIVYSTFRRSQARWWDLQVFHHERGGPQPAKGEKETGELKQRFEIWLTCYILIKQKGS